LADVDNMVKWTPLTFMFFTSFLVISALYVSGLGDISKNIEEYDKQKYRLGIVMENTVTADINPGNPSKSYEHRRAVLPRKLLNNVNPADDKLGYKVNEGTCYIPRIKGLDGENFAFYVNNEDMTISADENCGDKYNFRPHVTTPVKVVTDAPNQPDSEIITLGIYNVE